MKLALTEEQLDKVLEYFDKEQEEEKFTEHHYDEFVRIFHRLLEMKDSGFIKPEEFEQINQPMFDILFRMKGDLPHLYGSRPSTETM